MQLINTLSFRIHFLHFPPKTVTSILFKMLKKKKQNRMVKERKKKDLKQ